MKLISWKTVWAMILVAFGSVVATNAAETDTQTGPPLRVGVAPVSPPLIFKEGKTIAGMEADFAQSVGRELGRPVKFVEMPFEDLIDALVEDKIDVIMSAMSITRAREFRVAFAEPYLRVGQMALVRAPEQYRYAGLQGALAKQTIGVKKGTTADLIVQKEFPKAKRKYYKTGDDAAVALAKKHIDLYVSDSPMIAYLAGMNESKGLVMAPMVMSDEVLAWAVKRSDGKLRQALNDYLKKAQKNGELDKIMGRWVPRLR